MLKSVARSTPRASTVHTSPAASLRASLANPCYAVIEEEGLLESDCESEASTEDGSTPSTPTQEEFDLPTIDFEWNDDSTDDKRDLLDSLVRQFVAIYGPQCFNRQLAKPVVSAQRQLTNAGFDEVWSRSWSGPSVETLVEVDEVEN